MAQLLAFNRKQVIEPCGLSLNAVVNEVRGMTARLMPENIEIVCCLEEDLNSVMADPGQMHSGVDESGVERRRCNAERGHVDS